MVQPSKDAAPAAERVCDSPSCAIPGSIHISQSMKIDEPREAPICRKEGEDQINMLVVPDVGGQRLIVFQLPKNSSVSCKVQQLLVMLKTELGEVEIDSTYLVNDLIHNVRYVVTVRTKSNCDRDDSSVDSKATSASGSRTPTKRKRKRSSSESSYSFSTKSNDVIEVKSRSSNERLTLDLRRNAQEIVTYPNRPFKSGITITIEDYKCLDQEQYLNDVIIDFYLKYLYLEKLPAQDRERTYVFNSFFYTKLSNSKCSTLTKDNESPSPVKQHANVKRWTKNVNIFEKDFVIVPIHQSQHWFLAVICYPALIGCVEADETKSDDSDELKNCTSIIIFDSLPSFTVTRPRVERDLKNYLKCEYNEKSGGKSSFFGEIKVIYADVPQQLNSSDCGLYLLQFVKNFFKDFVVTNSLRLLKKPLGRWFSASVIGKKRNELRKLIIRLAMAEKETKRKPRCN